MSLEARQLLLLQDTTVTCLECANRFLLDQGFAKKALEQLLQASTGAVSAINCTELL
jgi:hypothetical protein